MKWELTKCYDTILQWSGLMQVSMITIVIMIMIKILTMNRLRRILCCFFLYLIDFFLLFFFPDGCRWRSSRCEGVPRSRTSLGHTADCSRLGYQRGRYVMPLSSPPPPTHPPSPNVGPTAECIRPAYQRAESGVRQPSTHIHACALWSYSRLLFFWLSGRKICLSDSAALFSPTTHRLSLSLYLSLSLSLTHTHTHTHTYTSETETLFPSCICLMAWLRAASVGY